MPVLETARVTNESLSLYSSNEDRPYYLDVDVQLKITAGVRLASGLFALLTLVAAVGVTQIPADDNLSDRVAVLVVPTTLAAAILLGRDPTPLAARLFRGHRLVTGALITVLWMLALVRLW